MVFPLFGPGAFWLFMVRRDALQRNIDFQNPDFHDLPHLDDFFRILDKVIRKLGYMYQPILMNSQVYESSEVGHVCHHAFQFHPRTQVLYLLDPLFECRVFELRPGVTAWFLQFRNDIAKRWLSYGVCNIALEIKTLEFFH